MYFMKISRGIVFPKEPSRCLEIFHRIHSKKQAHRKSSNYEPLYGYLLSSISSWFFMKSSIFQRNLRLYIKKMVLLKIQTIEDGSFVLPKIIGIHFSFVTKIPGDTLLTKIICQPNYPPRNRYLPKLAVWSPVN